MLARSWKEGLGLESWHDTENIACLTLLILKLKLVSKQIHLIRFLANIS